MWLPMQTTEVMETTRSKVLTVSICPVWVQLSSLVTLRDIYQRQIADTRDLHKVGCLHEMRAGDGSGGDETSAVARLDTPRDFDALGVPYRRVRSGGRGSVKAEVVDGVD